MANADLKGRAYARIDEIKAGDTIEIDGDFLCAGAGKYTVYENTHGLFFKCSLGNHFLDHQHDGDGHLVGVYLCK